MGKDVYPWKFLWGRLVDIALYLVAVASLIAAISVGICAESLEQKWVIGLGMLSSAIGAILEFRQKSYFDRNCVEESILSNGLTAPYLNIAARVRHKLAASNVALTVAGIWVSGYGAVWG